VLNRAVVSAVSHPTNTSTNQKQHHLHQSKQRAPNSNCGHYCYYYHHHHHHHHHQPTNQSNDTKKKKQTPPTKKKKQNTLAAAAAAAAAAVNFLHAGHVKTNKQTNKPNQTNTQWKQNTAVFFLFFFETKMERTTANFDRAATTPPSLSLSHSLPLTLSLSHSLCFSPSS